jgi:uncharacterized SAM-binding protein YcdF (DUF218 family)
MVRVEKIEAASRTRSHRVTLLIHLSWGHVMFYYASQIVFFFIQPTTLAVLALGTGFLLLVRSGGAVRFGRLGRVLICGGLAWTAVAGFLPIGDLLMLPLEEKFTDRQPPAADPSAKGIVILGGFEDGWVTAGRGGLALNEAAKRLTEGGR